uniref:Methyltransferase like 22 n=1 Tax=Denticeps clupeoides TaxID=299321 RepID=A0AAY4CYU6_9TELE
MGKALYHMDRVSFRSDTVLSDVHLLLPNTCHLMSCLNGVGQPVFVSKFRILRGGNGGDCAADLGSLGEEGENGDTAINPQTPLDEDGDLDVVRRPRDPIKDRVGVYPVILSQAEVASDQDEEDEEKQQEVIRIEHTMATPLEDVGKQVWRGAFLLADFILSQPTMFKGATVLELGAGTGLTSIVMATVAKMVYCTDIGEDLLNMCQRNVALNKHLTEPTGGDIKVRQLDWMADDLCTDSESDFSWTEEDVAELHDKTSFLLAADVCYDDDLTDAFFRTVYRITSHLCKPSTVYLSIEKRLNFTLRHMDVSCEAYDHFRHCLAELQGMADGKMKYTIKQLENFFPQFLQYERVDQLELWKITSSPLQTSAEEV